MKRLLHIALCALLLALPSCEIPFEVTSASGERFYAQCIADTDGVGVFVRSAAPVNGKAGTQKTPSISVEVNGEPLLMENNDIRWHGDRRLKEGDRISFHIEADGMEPADGSTTLPSRPVILNCSWKKVQVDTIEATQVFLTLDQAPSDDAFFGIRIEQTTHVEGSNEWSIHYITPGYILSAAESGSFDLSDFVQVNYDGYMVGSPIYRPLTLLTKKHFDGAVYRFYLNSFDTSILDGIRGNMPSGDTGVAGGGITSGDVGSEGTNPGTLPTDVKVDITYTFTLYRLSQEFYYYAKALYQSNFDFLANMGLIPANFTWSNLDGGLGFVGALQGAAAGPFRLDGEN